MMHLTAKSWDSYVDTLLTVLSDFKPEIVLEFGSGKSTGILAMAPSVKELFTYEHDQEYFSKFNKAAFDNLEMYLIEDEDAYASDFKQKGKLYDLIFIDGVNRPRCLKESLDSLSEDGLVMLHDSGREEYEESIKLYKYYIFTDGGHTVCLTNQEGVFNKLKSCLKDIRNIIGVKG